MNYETFLKSKEHDNIYIGFDQIYHNNYSFDFQNHIIELAIKKGRLGVFLDTGLGKSLIELIIAHNFVKKFNKKVLIITPLAVADQHIKESEKFDIPNVEHTKNGKFSKDIILINYERLHYINPNDFICVILDESSILKNADGKMRNLIISFLKKVKYRYLFTVTPSQNDYIELGNSSEALGNLGYTDMLTKFFKNNNNSIDARHAGEKWYLKKHAEKDFWKWVSSWSVSAKKPSDLGFKDDKYILPDLIENDIKVINSKPLDVNGQMSLWAKPAVNFHDIKKEVRNTLNQRCEKAVELSNNHETSVYWCNLNDESKLLNQLDKNAVQIIGSMSIEKKEDILSNFSQGNIKKLITKSSITGFGLNWQHCNHSTIFPTYSYEQYYQAIRRFYRFGQKNKVIIDRIFSDGQIKQLEVLKIKSENAVKMYDILVNQTNQDFKIDKKQFNKNINLPKFI